MSNPPFRIKDCTRIGLATGRRAHTLRELADDLATIDADCIYNHFWGRLLQPRFEEPEFANDFAAWAADALHDATLAERLAVIDPTRAADLEALREELLEIVAERLDESELLPWVRASKPFDFLHAQIVVFDTGHGMTDPADLADEIPRMTAGSVFYHFIDARRRLPGGGDDFSLWLEGFGERTRALREELAGLDPFFFSLTDTQRELANIVRAAGASA